MNRTRWLFALILALSLLGGTFTSGNAQDATPVASPQPGSVREMCADNGEAPDLGYRKIREDESASIAPPITEFDDCDTLKAFSRVLVLEAGESMLYNLPRAVVAIQVDEGTMNLSVMEGWGYAYLGDCSSPESQACKRISFENGSPDITLGKGESAIVMGHNAGVDSTVFVLSSPKTNGSASGNRMLQPTTSGARISGTGTLKAALSRGLCDTGAC